MSSPFDFGVRAAEIADIAVAATTDRNIGHSKIKFEKNNSF
jgi:hypothetical protein